jgi:hypothetical protein
MVGELLDEIMRTIGEQAFDFDLEATSTRLRDFIAHETYVVFVAQSPVALLR